MTSELQDWLDAEYPGYEAVDPHDTCAGFRCPHGHAMEVDAPDSACEVAQCGSPLVMAGM